MASVVVQRATSEPELLRWRASTHPERLAFTFLADGTTETQTLTYSQLDSSACGIAVALTDAGVQAGDRVVLLVPAGVDFLKAYWGCLYAGAIAVPCPPAVTKRTAPRVQRILEDARPSLVIGAAAVRAWLDDIDSTPGAHPSAWLSLQEATLANPAEYREREFPEDAGALLQYTSGSTTTPKGVLVTHGNLLANQEMICKAMGHSETSAFVSWLPQYHDMGLIGNLMQPLHLGTHCVFMPPEVFLRNPVLWLRAISRYRAHTSGAPDFGYALCARRISAADMQDVDLRSWEVAYNGAEPVRASTMRRFSQAFAPFGFAQRAFYPTFGLAEATLMVSGGRKGEGPAVVHVDVGALAQNLVRFVDPGAEAVEVVSCGRALEHETICIVEPRTRIVLPAGQVGEVWVTGPNVAAGYWEHSAETEGVFQAALARGSGRYLRTGDLGFLHEEQLYITGRIKDLLVLRGRNVYPNDIEAAIESSDPLFSVGGCAAFSVDTEAEEALVVVAETPPMSARKRGLPAIAKAVSIVAEVFGVGIQEMALVARGSIPRTTSGKVQRIECRERFHSDRLKVFMRWVRGSQVADSPNMRHDPEPRALSLRPDRPPDRIANWLATRLAEACNLPRQSIDFARPVTSYGLDSIRAIELQHDLERTFGVTLSPSYLLSGRSVLSAAHDVAAESARSVPAASGDVKYPGMSFGQWAIWFEQQAFPTSGAYNLFVALSVVSGFDASLLQSALRALCMRHELLRTVFPMGDAGPEPRLISLGSIRLAEIDSHATDAEFQEVLSTHAHQVFDLELGPLVRVTLFRRAAQHPVVLFVVHHIIADLWSMARLVSELIASCCTSPGARISEPEPTRSFSEVVALEHALISGAEGERLWSFWKQRIPSPEERAELPVDLPRKRCTSRESGTLHFDLDPSVAERLRHAAAHHGMTCFTLLASAVATLISRWLRTDRVLLGTLAAGRTQADSERIVGHFANPLLLNLMLPLDLPWAERARRVNDEVRSALDHQAFPFWSLVQRACPPRELYRSAFFDVMFAYQQLPSHPELAPCILGRRSTSISLHGATFESVPLVGRECRYDLTFYLVESADGFEGSVVYDRGLFYAETMSGLLDHFVATVDELLLHMPPVRALRQASASDS